MPSDSPIAAAPGKIRRGAWRSLRIALIVAGSGAVGWFAGSLPISTPKPEGTPAASPLRELAMFLLAGTVVTAVHELGHLAASRLVGFRLALFSVFPLSVTRGPRGWRVGLTRGLGQCLAYPTDARDLRRRNLVYFSGGVASGFAFAAACGLALRLGVVPPGVVADFLGWCLWLGLALNALSLIPLGGQSDGFCLNVMRRPGPQADQLIAAFTMQILDMVGVRPRDADRSLVDALTQPACTPNWQLMGQNSAYFAAIDSGRLDEARTLLGGLWGMTEGTPSGPNVALELAYFAAAHGDDVAEARRRLDQANGQGSPFARVLAEAAIRLAEGQPAEALAVLEPARPDFVALTRAGTGLTRHMIDQFEGLVARASAGGRP